MGAIDFPKLNNSRIVDEAGLFSATQKASLEHTLATYETNTTNQIVVVTLSSLQGYDIADYGYQLGRYWGIGTKEHNNGVLLIIAPSERKVRIEVGYGLEGALPDAIANTIIQKEILPTFKQGRYFEGASNGVNAIISATKGEYKASKKSKHNKSFEFYIFPILFLLFMMFQASSASRKPYQKRFVPALFFGTLAGVFSWFLFMILGLSFGIAIVIFLLTFFGEPPFIGGHHDDSWGSGSSNSNFGSFSSGNFGGFSGGGGSFGGGGASGSW